MKKLTLALLLALSSQAFAQNSEMLFSTGIIHYTGQHSALGKNNELQGNGYQAALYYVYHFKWLQLGAGFDFGILSSQTFSYTLSEPPYQTIPVDITEQHRPLAPYFAPGLQASFRIPVNQWSFYAGPSGGYIIGTAQDEFTYKAQGATMIEGTLYDLGGWYAGAQAGIIYKFSRNWSLSAEAMARFTKLEIVSQIPGYLPSRTAHDKLNMYNFSLGARYRF